MNVNFGSAINVVLTNSKSAIKNNVLFDYTHKKVVYQRVFHNDALIKTVHENGFTNYSRKSGKPVLVFFENALKRVFHAFSEKTGNLKRLGKKDSLTKSDYLAKFDEKGHLRCVTVFEADKNAFKSKYFLNENGDVIKIRRKKPDFDGDLAIKYNSEADEIEFIQKRQRLCLDSGLFQKEEISFNNDFGGKLVKKVTKELSDEGVVTTEITKYAQKDNKAQMREYIMLDSSTLHPLIYETFDRSGNSTFLWCVETAHKSPQPQHFVIAGRNLYNKPVDVSKIAQKDYYEMILSENFLKNRIKYSDTMNK